MKLRAWLRSLFAPSAKATDSLPGRSRTGQFTPSRKTRRQMNREASVRAQLAVYCATTPLSQRASETTAFFARGEGR